MGGPLTIDIAETDWQRRERASTTTRGYHPLLAVAAGTGDAARLPLPGAQLQLPAGDITPVSGALT